MEDARQVWEVLADSWTHLRTKPEKEVIGLSKTIKGPILDVGCGNGRNMLPFLEKGKMCVGIDFSRGMIKEAKRFLRRRGFNAQLIVGDMKHLPLKSNTFNTVLLIRTLHHGETKIERIQTLREVKRVGKMILISVWKKWQKRFFWKLLKNFFMSDIYVEWNYHGKIYKRFYHLYTKHELKKELESVGIVNFKIWEDGRGNIWAIVS
ncbi:MAG TPA: class I SAM-dependent methyltransferase [Candidatus Aenigmarchaeota archaeon]|nr:class I SAM-dependent methyltransferase [Candidatus Aenigmarchaeota archaeon]